jgi:DNA-binding NarL/FixJ family response regulator
MKSSSILPTAGQTAKKISVILVDDHAIVRLGLRTLINDQPDIEVVGEAGTAQEALREVERHQPQVVLMDIRLPGEGGLEATRQIVQRFPQVNVVMLTSFADEELVVSAIRAGAVGYLLKEVGNEEVLHGIRLAVQGKSVMDASTTSRLVARLRASERKEQDDAFRDLSERELQVLNEVAQGKTNLEIAQSLNLSEKTARNYVSTLLEKLHLSNRIELATHAVKYHLSERMKKE